MLWVRHTAKGPRVVAGVLASPILLLLCLFTAERGSAQELSFEWSFSGPIAGKVCVQFREPSERPRFDWGDNFLCSDRDWGLQWSFSGPIEGMRCTKINEPSEPRRLDWDDNFLCQPVESPLLFEWFFSGVEPEDTPGFDCVRINEPSEPSRFDWGDNFLCVAGDADGDGLLDSWEDEGIDTPDVTLVLDDLGAEPDHKDLYLELDYMAAPGGREGIGTCSDGVDNDADGNPDGADTDCVTPEAAPNSCSDGTDNDGDGQTDGADPNCSDAFSGREAPLGSCADGLDNDGNGSTDLADGNCAVLIRRGEAAPGSCGDGVDNDGDGMIDGADVECTAAPRQFHIRRMEAAFCSAPIDAGGGVPNPDGQLGINLWVDAGNLIDPTGRETPIRPCSCGDGSDNDMDLGVDGDDADCLVTDATRSEDGAALVPDCGNGIDDDGDGLADGADPQCLVVDPTASETPIGFGTCGDGLDNDGDGVMDSNDADCRVGNVPVGTGNGNLVALQKVCRLNSDFYDVKDNNFDRDNRALVFRYGLSAVLDSSCRATGGQGEIGGNDFVDFNNDGGTVMHELGHTLNLRHGGDNNRNCKPNYVSVMNYDNQFGVRQSLVAGQRTILDYSPPRTLGARGLIPGAIDESDLNESTRLDPADNANFFVYKGPGSPPPYLTWPMSGDGDNDGPGDGNGNGLGDGVDWDNDGDTNQISVNVNIDTSGNVAPAGSPANLQPRRCANSNRRTLEGFDDWANISLNHRPFGDSADSALRPTNQPEPTLEELRAIERAVNTTDLAVAKSGPAAAVEIGSAVSFIVNAENRGPNPTTAELRDSLPPSTDFVGAGDNCERSTEDTLVCDLGIMTNRDSRTVQVTVDTSSSCEAGLPVPIHNEVSIASLAEPANPDPVPDNNRTSVSVDTKDTTAPTVECNAVDTIEPPNAPISFRASGEDVCAGAVMPEITAFDCFAFTKKGKRIDKTESCVVRTNGNTITIEDSGGVGTQVIWTAKATDPSGNLGTTQCEVEVVRSGKGR